METDWDPDSLSGGTRILWKADVGFGHSNVAIKDNRLYTMGGNEVFCLNAETGEEIWQYEYKRDIEFQSTPPLRESISMY